jgi:hypothetical protein
MSVVRSLTWCTAFRSTTLAAIAFMAAATPSSGREPLASGIGVTPAPAMAAKSMRLTCRVYFGCVPAFQPASPLEKENQ